MDQLVTIQPVAINTHKSNLNKQLFNDTNVCDQERIPWINYVRDFKEDFPEIDESYYGRWTRILNEEEAAGKMTNTPKVWTRRSLNGETIKPLEEAAELNEEEKTSEDESDRSCPEGVIKFSSMAEEDEWKVYLLDTLYGVRKARTKRKFGYRNIPKTKKEIVEDDDDEEVDESSDEEKEEDGVQKIESAYEEKEGDGEKQILQKIRYKLLR